MQAAANDIASGPTERVPFQVFKDMDAIVKIIGVQVLQYILQAVVPRTQVKKLIKYGERRVEVGKVSYDVSGGLLEPADALLHVSYRSKADRISKIRTYF